MRVKVREVAIVSRGRHTSPNDREKRESKNLLKTAILRYANVDLYSENLLLENTIKANENFEEVYIDLYGKYANSIVQSQELILPVNSKNKLAKFINRSANFENLIYSNEIIYLKVNRDKIEPKFLYFILTLPEMVNKLSEEKKLKCETVEEIEFELPDKNEQQKVVKQLEKVNLKRLEIENYLKKMINK
ncbi:MAG: restriction endonuclease subunit S [Clostridia bacterium]